MELGSKLSIDSEFQTPGEVILRGYVDVEISAVVPVVDSVSLNVRQPTFHDQLYPHSTVGSWTSAFPPVVLISLSRKLSDRI